MGTAVRNQCSILLLLIWSALFLKWSEGACPSHCQSSGSVCDAEPDDGCPVCEQEYYGRQCDLRMECRFTDLGTEYRGAKNTTKNGITCQRWDSQFPNPHSQSGPELEENYCRNPDNSSDTNGPWCYSTDPHIRYQGCGIPPCSQQCKQPTLPPGASALNPATPGEGFFVGFILNIRCPDGAPRQSNCSQNENVIDWSPFTCPDIYCERTLNVNIHIEPDKSQYLYGERINVLCDTGYETMNRTQFRCQQDTSWDGIFPTCTAMECPPPMLNPDTHIVSPKLSYFYQDEITIECNTGFEHLNQNGSRSKHICQANKAWNGNLSSCQVVKCSVPSLNNVTRISQDTWKTDYVYKDKISLTCETGYEIADNVTKYNCTEQKTFYPQIQNCTAVVCPVTEIPPNLILKPRQPTYFFKNVIYIFCQAGFSSNSSDEYLACLASKKINGSFPSCIRKKCEAPLLPCNSYLTTTTRVFLFDDVVQIHCNQGYELKGEATITCLADQTWSNFPYCAVTGSQNTGLVAGIAVCSVVAAGSLIFAIVTILRKKASPHLNTSSGGNVPPTSAIGNNNLNNTQPHQMANDNHSPNSSNDQPYSSLCLENIGGKEHMYCSLERK